MRKTWPAFSCALHAILPATCMSESRIATLRSSMSWGTTLAEMVSHSFESLCFGEARRLR